MAAQIDEINYKISSKTHQRIVHISQLKLFVDSDSLPCHKVLTILDQQANQEDDPLIPDQFYGPDLSDTMKSDLDNVLSQFPSVFSNNPGNTISIKTTYNYYTNLVSRLHYPSSY